MSIGRKIEKVLDEEKRLLLKGDFKHLEDIINIKQSFSENLISKPLAIPLVQAQRIFQKANENRALLNSAQRGIQAAIAQLKETAEGTFQSYSKEGERTPLSKVGEIRKRL